MLSESESQTVRIGYHSDLPREALVLPLLRSVALGGSTCLLGGCSLRGAPSYNLFGAFFPGWLLCAVIGIVGSIGLRRVFIATSLEEAMPLRLVVYVAFAAGLTVSLWLLLFWAD